MIRVYVDSFGDINIYRQCRWQLMIIVGSELMS